MDGLSLFPHRKAHNAAALLRRGVLLFDPSVQSGDDPSDAFRVFVPPHHDSPLPAYRAPRGLVLDEPAVSVVVAGARAHHRELSARAGGGIWVEAPAPFAIAVTAPGASSSETAGCLRLQLINRPSRRAMLLKRSS